MSNERLEKLMNLTLAIALTFIMIIKGKIGSIGFLIFGFITMIIAVICIKRGIHKKPDALETIYLIVFSILGLIVVYLAEFKKNFDFKLFLIFLVSSAIWFLAGGIFFIIRKKRRERL